MPTSWQQQVMLSKVLYPPTTALVFAHSATESNIFDRGCGGIAWCPSLYTSQVEFTPRQITDMISVTGISPRTVDSLVHLCVVQLTSATATVLSRLGKRDPLTVSSRFAGSLRFGVSKEVIGRTIIFPTPLRPSVVCECNAACYLLLKRV